MTERSPHLEDHHIKTIETVAEHGFQTYFIFESEDAPSFCYSIGFWETLNAPEVIIFGLPSSLANSCLWSIFRQIRDGQKLNNNAVWKGIVKDHDCVSRKVHPSQIGKYLLRSLWYKNYRTHSDDVEAFQIFWPSVTTGLFPWEKDCAKIVRWSQPRLDLPDNEGLA